MIIIRNIRGTRLHNVRYTLVNLRHRHLTYNELGVTARLRPHLTVDNMLNLNKDQDLIAVHGNRSTGLALETRIGHNNQTNKVIADEIPHRPNFD